MILPTLLTVLLAADPTPEAAISGGSASPVAVAAGSVSAVPAWDPAVIDSLVIRSRELHLGDDPYWQQLLHYGWGMFGTRGLVDSPGFYLAEGGHRDPQAEVEATLRGLFTGNSAEPESAIAARFPARTRWLCERLGIDRSRLPVPSSPEIDRVLQGIKPRKATLVFPSGYLGNPSSMFGHTFLLIHGQEKSPLLAQSINFAAQTPEGGMNPIVMLRGVAGGLPGAFSILAYHRKVQEYSDLDQRDMWEYELTLSPEEVERIVLHTMEMRGHWSEYFFFDENCSFNLLFLIEAARPGLHLTDGPNLWVVPVDTVRSVRDAGLVRGITYRPSRATIVAHGRAELGRESDLAVDLAHGSATASQLADAVPDPARRAQVLDLAGETLHAVMGRHQIGLEDYRTRLHQVLTTRAALGDQPGLSPVPVPIRPDLGHGTSRISGGGGRQDGSDLLTVGWRPAQHDLLDDPTGYVAGGEVQFMNLEGRWYDADDRFVLNRADVVEITSLNPYEAVFQRMAWRLGTGLLTERMGREGDLRLQVYGQAGGGLSVQLPGGAGQPWVMATAEGRGFDWHEGGSIAPGGQAGWLLSLPLGSGAVSLMPTASAARSLIGVEETQWEVAGSLRVSPWRFLAVDLGASRYHRWERTADGVQARIMGYF